MHAMVRRYSGQGATELFELLVERKDEVENLIRGVSGLVSYNLVTTEDGGMTITLCQDRAGTDESLSIAMNWLKENAAHLNVDAPSVSEGVVAIHAT